MFGAIGRWFKALGYLLTGQIDSARRVIDTNPHVVRAKYDQVVKEKVAQIHTYKQAVAGLIAQQENKIGKVKRLTEEIEQLERLRAGALAKAKQTVAKLIASGVSKEEVHQHEDYQKCLSAYNDFTATLTEKQDHINENEQDVGSYAKTIGEHKVQLQQLLRDVDKIKGEAHDAVADIITAKQETEIADMLSGISRDGSAKELQDLRELRQQVRAEARVSKEMAGTDTKAQEAEFLDYARRGMASAEFDSLIGLSDATLEAPKPASPEKSSTLPE